MGRSTKKGPYVDAKLLKKIQHQNQSSDKKVIKTWARGSVITPDFVGHTIAVHTGKSGRLVCGPCLGRPGARAKANAGARDGTRGHNPPSDGACDDHRDRSKTQDASQQAAGSHRKINENRSRSPRSARGSQGGI